MPNWIRLNDWLFDFDKLLVMSIVRREPGKPSLWVAAEIGDGPGVATTEVQGNQAHEVWRQYAHRFRDVMALESAPPATKVKACGRVVLDLPRVRAVQFEESSGSRTIAHVHMALSNGAVWVATFGREDDAGGDIRQFFGWPSPPEPKG